MKKIFPIHTETACVLKWAWSTIYLKQGKTASCHRTDHSTIDPNNFAGFHNHPDKIAARKLMLDGKWPKAGCQYCEKIENAGGMSDRQLRSYEGEITITPEELFDNPTQLDVDPTILEIYFNNVCNMACVYCGSHFSSKWEEENKKYGVFKQGTVIVGLNKPLNLNYDKMLADFWKYLEENNRYKKIKSYQILGGEPFYQKEFDTSIEFWENHPNPDMTFTIITNLKVPHKRFCEYVARFEKMVSEGKLAQLRITGSLDAWGPQEEYVRWGLDLKEWEENFTYCLDKPWIVLTINSAISALTIKTMPKLIEQMNKWNQQILHFNKIYFSFMSVTDPLWLRPEIFGAGVFDEDFKRILGVMPTATPSDIATKEHMAGIFKQVENHPRDLGRINDLKVYLTELDRRRGTNWKELFPWLDQEF
jgi:organic radical activating enzyme